MVGALLDVGASDSAERPDGVTPLMMAIAKGCDAVAELLIDRGADVNYPNRHGATAISAAAQFDRRSVRFCSAFFLFPLVLFLWCGLELGWICVDDDPRCPTCRSPASSAFVIHGIWGCRAIADLLIAGGASVNHVDANSTTPLILAARKDACAVAKALIASGAKVDAATKAGETPLIAACRSGSAVMVGMLLDAGAKANKGTPPKLCDCVVPFCFSRLVGHPLLCTCPPRLQGSTTARLR